MRLGALSAVWLLASCNDLLGIDPVVPDRIGDPDGGQSCVGHDEDRDGHVDRCDVCPSIADKDQLSTRDFDEVGDACDGDSRPDSQRVFDPFTAENPGLWPKGLAAGWSLHDDVLDAKPGDTMQLSSFDALELVFSVETLATQPSAGDAGFVATVAGGAVYTCVARADRTLEVGRGTTYMTSGPVPGTGPIRLRWRVDNALTDFITQYCEAIDDAGLVVARAMMLARDSPAGPLGLRATGATSFSYLWLTSSP
jgi:hypothetical protein